MKNSEHFSAVGQRSVRVDSLEKVTGKAKFSGDHSPPGLLHAALVKSSHARGTLTAVDGSEALSLPGVVAVITGADLARLGCVDPYYGVVVRDRATLAATNDVRFAGEAVAVVVAESRELARHAAKLVDVDIEELPAVTTLDEALAPDAPLVHGSGYDMAGEVYAAPAPLEYGTSNAVMEYKTSRGNTEEAFANAARVIEGEYTFPAVYHYAMEPHTVVADADEDSITVWSSAQHPNQVQGDLARMWQRPLSSVRVIATYVGGGFGSKSFTHVEPVAVLASMVVGRPVRLELDVSEAMGVSRRHGMRGTARVAVDKDGRISAFAAELDYDGGAYTLLGPYVVAKGAFRGLGGYDFPAYSMTTRLVYTNTSPAGSFRAIGGPQAAWALESMIDKVSRELGRDPLDLRRALVAKRGAEFRPGRNPMDGELQDTLDLLSDARDNTAQRLPGGDGGSWRQGSAISLGVSDPGASAVSSAIIRLMADGSVVVAIGSSELGQGVRTVVAQIVAETMQVDVARVHVLPTDTGTGPFDASTGASRSTTMSGLAAHRAASSVMDRVAAHVAEHHGCDVSELVLKNGQVVTPDGAEVPYESVVHAVFGARGGNLIGVGEVSQLEFPKSPAFWEIAGGCADVAVDVSTGQVKVLRYLTTSDVGRVVNPTSMEGQEEGAFAQGMGHALFEELRWESGQPITDSLVNYRVPRSTDIPLDFHSEQVENHDGPGAYGIKGGGEGPIMPAASAIGSALYDACGVEIRDLPLHPERVWRSLVAAGVAVSHVDSRTEPMMSSSTGSSGSRYVEFPD